VFTGAGDAVLPGLLLLAAVGSLGWVFVTSVPAAAAPQVWSLIGCRAAGPLFMLVARFVSRPAFCQVAGVGRNWTRHGD
jgi:hypothetical protein